VKTIHQITVGDVILLEDTKSGKHLKGWMPFSTKKLEKLVAEIFEKLGADTADELERKFDKILSYRRLQLLEALWKALDAELNMKLTVGLLLIDKKLPSSDLLDRVVDKIKDVTGIEIKDLEDVEKFKKHIEFRNTKHQQLYFDKKIEEKTDFTKIIYSYFNYMDEPFNENMRYLSFLTMKKMADEIALKKSMDNG
jgi:hypothetical protein